MSSQTNKLFSACPTKRELFDASDVAESPDAAIAAWARDESVEFVSDVHSLLSRGLLGVYEVQPKPVTSDLARQVAEETCDEFLKRWDAKYGSAKILECPSGAYRECRAAIEEALGTLSLRLKVGTYEAVSSQAYTVDEVVSVLRLDEVVK